MVEVNNQTGAASDPWHSIGRSISDATTIEQAIRIADLDWEVELDEPVFVASKKRVIDVPGFASPRSRWRSKPRSGFTMSARE